MTHFYTLYVAHYDCKTDASLHHSRTQAEDAIHALALKLWLADGHRGEPLPCGPQLLEHLLDHGECVHLYCCEVGGGPGTEIDLTRETATA